MNIYQKIKEIAFIIAGALIGIAFIPFEKEISNYFAWFVYFILFLILLGLGFFDWVKFAWIILNRKINKRRKKVCIYAPYEIDQETSSWINVSLRQIQNAIESEKIKVTTTKNEKNILRFPLVINPYGGVYPEKDLSTLASLDFIFKYVREGGVYVNIADIPFYYAFDSSLSRRVDTTPLAGDFSQVRSFLQTILTKKLHCFVWGLTSGEDFNNGIHRIISLSSNSKNLFRKEIAIDEIEAGSYSPILAIPYGKGYFIFSTIQIEKVDKFIVLIKKSLKFL